MPSRLINCFISISTKLVKKQSCVLLNHNCAKSFSLSTERKMRLVQFKSKSGGRQEIGAQLSVDGDIVHISAIDKTMPNTLLQFVNADDDVKNKAKRIVADTKFCVPLTDVNLLAPITRPDKVACVGFNYSGHCIEQNVPFPKEPMIFSKFSSVITGPYDNIELTKITQKLDWEVELAVIIGKKAKAIEPDQAKEYIFGYTVAQDISARDWQKKNNGQYLLGKSMDTFCPMGPAVVTTDILHEPDNLTIKTWVNGILKQSGNTSEMIFKTNFLVSYLSKFVTLYPGDVILTGTPAGVGVHRNPPEFLNVGDVVESEIGNIGRMRNEVVMVD